MKTNLHSLSIHFFPGAAIPVQTAAHWTSQWLKSHSEITVPVVDGSRVKKNGFQIILGTLDQPELKMLLVDKHLPLTVRLDGYVLALRENCLVIYGNHPRSIIYACGYELTKILTFKDDDILIDLDLLVSEPDDRLRAWCTWQQDLDFFPNAATQYRLNMVWMDASVTCEVLLPGYPEFQPYLRPHEDQILEKRRQTEKAVALSKSFGLETYIGGLNGFFVIPPYLYQGIIHHHPEMLASGYKGGSQWAPYEWQDRPVLCPSEPETRHFYQAIVDEFLTSHPETDGVCMGVGYDGYPLGCGCDRCQDYEYYDRFRDQVMWVFDIAVKKHHKKLWLWTWVVGCNSVIPGYDHYYGWVKEFSEANPTSVVISSFATEADFLMTHRPNPVIGSRGPNDMGMVLLWPEYRGDGAVPAWILDWMEKNLPLLRAQGAQGFAATDTCASIRKKDHIQGAEMYALAEMMWDHSVTAQQAALEYCARQFGAEAAHYLVPALRQSGSVIAKTLFLPGGVRFSGHSHIENDLRVMWEIYTLYDSAPSFLNAQQRQQIISSGPPYAHKVEALLPELQPTNEAICRIIIGKDQAVEEASWILNQIELARPHLTAEHYDEMKTRCLWLYGYARLFRGLATAFFHLRRGLPEDGKNVKEGTGEMSAAMSLLPQSGPPLPYDILAQFGDYPWMITPPFELINALESAGHLLELGVHSQPIGIFSSEEAIGALDTLFLPYTRISLDDDPYQFKVIVVGTAAMKLLDDQGEKLAAFIQSGGRLLLYNPGENWEALPTRWLPGNVQCWVCNHPKVTVTQPKHPVTAGYLDLKSEPISRFQATSAGVTEARRFSPFIKSFIVSTNQWKMLTHPGVLAETRWGDGIVFINLIPENRTILLRTLAYLYNLCP
jgi:hypothetical protein